MASTAARALAAAALCLVTAPAVAEPLTYPFRPAQPVVRVIVTGDAAVSYGPPLGPPVTISLADGTSTLAGRPNGSAVADTGLPDFAGGAHGIWLSSFEADTEFTDSAVLFTDIFGQLPPIPTPVPLVGAAFVADIAQLVIRTEEPLVSPLLRNGPNRFLWAGEAALTIEGAVNLSVLIPGQEPIGLPEPIPFSVPLDTAALTGGFSGDAVSTTLDVGLEPLDVSTEATGAIAISLGALGSLNVNLTRLDLRIDGTFSGVNRTHGLPPATGGVVGCGMGPELALLMPALCWMRRRRR
jgi:hypothetical protein